MFHDFGKFILDGGVAVYGMLALACFAMAVTWERAQALYFKYTINSEVFLKQIRTMILNDKIEEAIAFCSAQKTALLPKVIKGILERADRDDENIRTAHDLSSMEVVPLITRGLGYLAMTANVATLIGLLGTIHGLIQSFQAVSFADPAQKQTLLAQGISISMNTTAMGLFVAIPTMVVYSLLQARQNKLLEEIIAVSAKVVDILISRNFQPYEETAAFPSADVGALGQKNGSVKRKAV